MQGLRRLRRIRKGLEADLKQEENALRELTLEQRAWMDELCKLIHRKIELAYREDDDTEKEREEIEQLLSEMYRKSVKLLP